MSYLQSEHGIYDATNTMKVPVNGAVLLKFLELFTRLSKIYEIDLTYSIVGWLAAFKSDLEMLNGEIMLLEDKLQQASYEKHHVAFLIEIFVDDMLIDLKQVEPEQGGSTRYFTEFERNFGGEFDSGLPG